MAPNPSDNILAYVLWALVGLVVVMGGALVWVIKSRNGRSLSTGDTPPEKWEKILDGLAGRLDSISTKLAAMGLQIHDASKDTAAIRIRMHDLTDEISGLSAAVNLLRAELKK